MTTVKKTKLVKGGNFVAEVDVTLLQDDMGWAPYLSPQDAAKLDDVRNALISGNVKTASQFGSVYELRPVVPA